MLQALVFGAAHANYPGLSRRIRGWSSCSCPAFIWGLIFLRFGLLPTIILHAMFDLALMSIPVFLVEGAGQRDQPGAGRSRPALVPLAIVLVRRVRAGRWLDAAATRCATAHGSAPPRAAPSALRAVRAAAGAWTARVQRALPLLGLAGLVGDRVRAAICSATRRRCRSIARQAEAARRCRARAARHHARARTGGASSIDPRSRTDDASAWQWHNSSGAKPGATRIAKLIGNWLAPPLWEVRYARFDGGDVADRAEEWRVTVAGDGTVRQVRHQLPEARPGAKLVARRRRARSRSGRSRQRFGLDPATLREVVGRGEGAAGAHRLAIHLSPIRASTSARAARRA